MKFTAKASKLFTAGIRETDVTYGNFSAMVKYSAPTITDVVVLRVFKAARMEGGDTLDLVKMAALLRAEGVILREKPEEDGEEGAAGAAGARAFGAPRGSRSARCARRTARRSTSTPSRAGRRGERRALTSARPFTPRQGTTSRGAPPGCERDKVE
jgi:hypothetical protein